MATDVLGDAFIPYGCFPASCSPISRRTDREIMSLIQVAVNRDKIRRIES